MARTNQIGIKFFSFDVDFFNDEKIEFTSARFGIKGEIIAIRLLCKIYRNGYYTQWNDDEVTLLAKRAGDSISPSLVSEVVKELVKRGFFDETLLNTFGILTSRGIQRRYFEATKRFKKVDVFEEFLLIEIDKTINTNINKINDNINYNNEYINQQTIRNNTKQYETIQKDVGEPLPPSLLQIDFDFVLDLYHKHCPLMPRVSLLNEARKTAVRARVKETDLEDVEKMIVKAGASEFLNGKNERSWIASFDWLFKPANFAKVLEGNYLKSKPHANFKPNDPRASAAEGWDEPL